MDDLKKKDLVDMQDFLLSDPVGALERYRQISPIHKMQFHLPEIDIPRMEICKAYITGIFIGCITLTNHLLERWCKLILISIDSGGINLSDISTLEERFRPHVER